MKKIIAIFLVSLTLNGCVSSAIKEKLHNNAAHLDGYVAQMDKGETTPEQDKALIQVMRIWTWSMNSAANGEEPPADVKLILDQVEGE